MGTWLTLDVVFPSANTGPEVEEARAAVRAEVGEALAEAAQLLQARMLPAVDGHPVALFEATTASETHAQRACYAAVLLQQDLAEFAEDVAREVGVTFRVALYLHTDRIEIDAAGGPADVDGKLIATLMRLGPDDSEHARPVDVRLSDATATMIRGLFELEESALRSDGAPERAWRLIGQTGHHTRFEAVRARGLARFAGREEEMAVLTRALTEAHTGRGQAVAIIGEPGIGKSRILHEFANCCEAGAVDVFRTHGLSQGMTLPFAPVLDLLRHLFGLRRNESASQTRKRVRDTISPLNAGLEHRLPLLYTLLKIGHDAADPMLADRQDFQRRSGEAVRDVLSAYGARRPVAIVIDDAQWLDSSSAAWLDATVPGLPDSRVLLVLGARPEYAPVWLSSFACTRVGLRPLPPADAGEVLADLLGPSLARQEFGRTIAERTAGNPLFVEETVQELVEVGVLDGKQGAYRVRAGASAVTMPLTVEAVLTARIGRLPPISKAVLQAAAVLGMRFLEAALRRIVSASHRELTSALHGLTDAQFFSEIAFHPDLQYGFKHPLTREAAYASIPPEQRRELHLRAATALEECLPVDSPDYHAAIAQHLLAAGSLARPAAILRHAGTAGSAALGACGFREAQRFLEAALEAADRLPDLSDAERADLGLKLLGAVGTLGELERAQHLADEVIASYERLERPDGADRARLEMATAFTTFTRYHDALRYLGPVADKAREYPTNLYLRALADYVHVADYAGHNPERILPTADLIDRHADRLNDPILKNKALTLAVTWYANHSHVLKEVVNLFRRRLVLSMKRGLRWERAVDLANIGYYELVCGRISRAMDVLDEGLRLALAMGAPSHIVNCRSPRALAFCLRGEWDRMEEEWAEAAPLMQRVPGVIRLGPLLTSRMRADIWLDRPRDRTLSPQGNYSQMTLAQAAMHAVLAFRVSEESPADAEEPLAAIQEGIPPVGAGIQWMIGAQALTAGWANLGRGAEAARWYDTLSHYRGNLYLSCVNLERGRVAALNRRWRDGLLDLNASIRRARREGLRPVLAIGLHERAKLYAMRGNHGDHARVRKTADEAAWVFESLGMKTWLERTEHLLT